MTSADSRSEAVEWQLVLSLYSQTLTLVMGGLALSLVAFFAWFVTTQVLFLLWTIVMVIVLAARLVLTWLFYRRRDNANRVAIWRNRFTVSSWVMGAFWGCAAFVIAKGVDPQIQMLIISVQTVIIMGAAARNSACPLAARGQVLLGLVPVFLADVSRHDLFGYVFSVVICFELFAAFALVHYLNANTVRFLCVDEKNSALVSEITHSNAELEAANRRLEAVAMTDALTGIANRRRFDAVLFDEASRAQRAADDLSLLILDIDSFKSYNDMYGHQAGDECLKSVAGALALALRRPADLVARYGGEEFVAVLPQTNLTAAIALAEALRARIEALAICHATGIAGIVTVSIGVASFSATRDRQPSDFIRAADEALYAAKGAGRNCVRVASAATESVLL